MLRCHFILDSESVRLELKGKFGCPIYAELGWKLEDVLCTTYYNDIFPSIFLFLFILLMSSVIGFDGLCPFDGVVFAFLDSKTLAFSGDFQIQFVQSTNN